MTAWTPEDDPDWVPIASIKGPKGDPGPRGEPGEPGDGSELPDLTLMMENALL